MWQLIEHYYSQNYTVFWLAEFFHSWPHISYNGLKKQDSTFDPTNQKYIESLIFWAAVPILWLLLTLVLSLFFSCCLCCKRRRSLDPSRARLSVNCPQRFLIIASFVCLGLLGVGYYGNETTAIGIHHFINSANGINDTVTNVDYKINKIEDDLGSIIPSEVASLESELRKNVSNTTALGIMLEMTASLTQASEMAAANLTEISEKISLSGLDSSQLISNIKYYDYFRWMGMTLILTFQVVTCLFILLAASKASRYLLVLSSILCIVCILMIWCLVGAELFIEVGLGDLCVDPSQYIMTETSKKSEISQDVLEYYIQCTDSSLNPFSLAITEANNYLASAHKSVFSLEGMVREYAPSSQTYVDAVGVALADVSEYTQHVTALVDCTGIHKDYITALNGICYHTIAGVGFLLVSGIVLGLLITLVLCMSSTLAARIARRKINYEVDQEDPFLPTPNSTATLERFRRRGQEPTDSARVTPPLAPISPTRPHSQHGFGRSVPSPPRYHRYEPPFEMVNPRPPAGRTSYVSHQRDSYMEDSVTTTRGNYDTPPPTYTMAMRRDGNRRTPDGRSAREEQSNQNRLSAGSASLV
ncbi:protein tweety homolog 1-B isoform X2 [Strongylocentrotus purpuratus]|uniref:Protein tweety homolog n=1 Tax=Strongylocentrotus purpuratus TaxID=7668 RepID=A0A7M7HD94_STRPU|nr:protein tweety homolog 1-B isoform X2 [Strongylocentrotus purpuratus]